MRLYHCNQAFQSLESPAGSLKLVSRGTSVPQGFQQKQGEPSGGDHFLIGNRSRTYFGFWICDFGLYALTYNPKSKIENQKCVKKTPSRPAPRQEGAGRLANRVDCERGLGSPARNRNLAWITRISRDDYTDPSVSSHCTIRVISHIETRSPATLLRGVGGVTPLRRVLMVSVVRAPVEAAASARPWTAQNPPEPRSSLGRRKSLTG